MPTHPMQPLVQHNCVSWLAQCVYSRVATVQMHPKGPCGSASPLALIQADIAGTKCNWSFPTVVARRAAFNRAANASADVLGEGREGAGALAEVPSSEPLHGLLACASSVFKATVTTAPSPKFFSACGPVVVWHHRV